MDETTTKIANAEEGAGVPALPVKSDVPPEEAAAQPMAEEQGPPPLPTVPDAAAADQADDSQLRTMVEEQGFVAPPMPQPEVHPTEGELQLEHSQRKCTRHRFIFFSMGPDLGIGRGGPCYT